MNQKERNDIFFQNKSYLREIHLISYKRFEFLILCFNYFLFLIFFYL